MITLDKTEIFKHPEMLEGEVLFTNADEESFSIMSYDTKRKGLVAYDGEGNKQNAEDWFPVFLQVKELHAKDLNLSSIRKSFWKEREVKSK